MMHRHQWALAEPRQVLAALPQLPRRRQRVLTVLLQATPPPETHVQQSNHQQLAQVSHEVPTHLVPNLHPQEGTQLQPVESKDPSLKLLVPTV